MQSQTPTARTKVTCSQPWRRLDPAGHRIHLGAVRENVRRDQTVLQGMMGGRGTRMLGELN